MGSSGGAAQTLTNVDDVAMLGKPKLGELYKCTIRIKESKEFKVRDALQSPLT